MKRGESAVGDDGSTDAPLCLFDGVCVLCNGTVRFILRHESGPTLRFCAVQSAAGQALLGRLGLGTMPETFLLVEQGMVFARSAAAFRLAAHLQAPWRWARVLSILPRPLTDWLYDRIARNRYRLFGRLEACPVPTPEHRARFL